MQHSEAMELTATENARLLTQLRRLTDAQWRTPTECTGWSVRDAAVHLISSAEGQAGPVEFVRQLRARAEWTPAMLPELWERHSAAALKARRRMPAPIRELPLLPIGTGLGVHIGWQPLRYLYDLGFTWDVWMHRIDITRAAGIEPELTPEHDGRILADIVAEWSSRHGQPYTLTLTGPAGGTFHAGDDDLADQPQRVDAVEFAAIISGRVTGTGILRHKLPL